MTLTIDRLSLRYRRPRSAGGGQLLDDPAAVLARWTPPPAAGGVCRVRRLTVPLRVSAADLADGRLPELWLAAFARSLALALAPPDGAGPVEVVRAASSTAWRAKFLADLLAGRAFGRWEYREFEPLMHGTVSEGALRTLLDEPAATLDVLAALADAHLLDALVRTLGAAALDRLIDGMSEVAASPEADWHDLLAAAVTLAKALGPAESFLSPRRRIVAFVLLRRAGLAASWLAPRELFAVLDALEWLVAHGPDALLGESAGGRVSWLDRLSERPAAGAARLLGRAAARSADERAALAEACATLRGPRPVVTVPREEAWIASDCAGVFLLTESLLRLRWVERLPRRWQGERAFVLAAVAARLFERFSSTDLPFDPGLRAFAGFENVPDREGYRRFLARTTAEDRDELLAAWLGPDRPAAAAGGWAATCDALADRLVREFLSRVRGFRQSSRRFAVRQLLAGPGRIRVAPRAVTVHLAPTPFQVALHVSGADSPVGGVPWLDHRDVAFVLEGL